MKRGRKPKKQKENTMKQAIKLCKSDKCNDMQTIHGFCRLHYLKQWRKLKETESTKKGSSFDDYLRIMSDKYMKTLKFTRKESEKQEKIAPKRVIDFGPKVPDGVDFGIKIDDDLDEILNQLKVVRH